MRPCAASRFLACVVKAPVLLQGNFSCPIRDKSATMRTQRQTLLSSALAAGICVTLSIGADGTAASDSGAWPPLVGDLGRPEALLLQGNSTFTREQILSGLAAHLDFHLASHRLAPREEYAAQLKRQITLGYLRSGFPDVKVQATPDTNTRQMLVQISEGPRYRCGSLLLSGFQAIDSASAKEKIMEKLSGLEPGAVPQSNQPPPLWAVDQPAPCDEFARVGLTALVQEALTDLDRFEAKADVRVVPDPDRRRADLQVKILDEGFPGTLEEIEVMGARINTSQQVLDYLKLRPGLDLSARLIKGVTNQLANSGRFMRAETTLEPLPKRGTFRLVIDLDELRQTPPLDQEFSPVEKGLLKFRDWIMDWGNRAEDLVWSFQLHPSWAGSNWRARWPRPVWCWPCGPTHPGRRRSWHMPGWHPHGRWASTPSGASGNSPSRGQAGA